MYDSSSDSQMAECLLVLHYDFPAAVLVGQANKGYQVDTLFRTCEKWFWILSATVIVMRR